MEKYAQQKHLFFVITVYYETYFAFAITTQPD